jgi:hypothetical protein
MTKKGATIEEEHAWLASQNLAQYAGCWLAVFGMAIIAEGKTLKEVTTIVKQKRINDQDPLYVRVPNGLISS